MAFPSSLVSKSRSPSRKLFERGRGAGGEGEGKLNFEGWNCGIFCEGGYDRCGVNFEGFGIVEYSVKAAVTVAGRNSRGLFVAGEGEQETLRIHGDEEYSKGLFVTRTMGSYF